MRRRTFIAIASVALSSWPDHGSLALAPRLRVCFMSLAPASAWEEQVKAFEAGLAELGYVVGETIAVEYFWAQDGPSMVDIARRIVESRPDVIIAPASTQVAIFRQLTTTIPIVFAQHADPIAVGHVTNLAHPGGNISGVSMLLTEMSAKGLAILRDTVPTMRVVATLWNPSTPSHRAVMASIQATAERLNVRILSTPVETEDDLPKAFAAMTNEKDVGFLVPSSPLTNSRPVQLAALAHAAHVPGMFANRANVVAGGLMSYGANFNYMYKRTATYVDRVIKGERIGNIPVEQASHYELVLNNRTAHDLGLDIPFAVLALADEVIE